MTRNQLPENAKNGLLAAGGLAGALGASSCCVLPLALVVAGVSGAWIGGLTALAPYQFVFVGIGALSVGSGFWRVYGRRKRACEGKCGTAASLRWTKVGLWIATALLLIAATTRWWPPLVA